jgi:hypothetical protein
MCLTLEQVNCPLRTGKEGRFTPAGEYALDIGAQAGVNHPSLLVLSEGTSSKTSFD